MGIVSSLVACTDPVVGDWELVDLRPGGLTATYTYSGYDANCGYYSLSAEAELWGELVVDEDLDADFEISLEIDYTYATAYCGTDSDTYSYDYTYSGDVSNEGDGDYDIDLRGDGERLELSCNLDGDELECEDGDVTYIFEKQ